MDDLVLCCNSSIIESLRVIYCYCLSLHPCMIVSQSPEAPYWAPTFPTCLENTLHSALHTSTLLIPLRYTWGITKLCHKEEPQFLVGNEPQFLVGNHLMMMKWASFGFCELVIQTVILWNLCFLLLPVPVRKEEGNNGEDIFALSQSELPMSDVWHSSSPSCRD